MEFTEAAHGEHPLDSEFRVVQPVGIRWVRARARLIADKGAPGRMVGICEDITTRKLAEASLQQTEKLAAMGRLASSIAHEINNPLESVTNLLYLARISEDPPRCVPTSTTPIRNCAVPPPSPTRRCVSTNNPPPRRR